MARLGPTCLTQVFVDIKNWVVSKLSPKANDSDVVHKSSNETINGIKYFTSGPQVTNNQTTMGYSITNTALARNDVPSEYYHHSFRAHDKNYKILGEYCIEKSTTGDTLLNMGVRSEDVNGNQIANSLLFKMTNDGSVVKFMPSANNKVYLGDEGAKWLKVYSDDVVHTSGNETIAGTKTFSSNIVGNLTGSSTSCTGNSVSATKLATARTINIQDSDGTNTGTAVTFNGTTNGVIKLPATIKATITGNADTATQFSANKSVTLTGDVTGTASSNAGWSVATTLANSGANAGTYGPTADVTGNNNATIVVPQITVDAKGRVTAVTTKTLTCKNNTYTVNDATLTIQKNGTTVKTFTANASSDVTANITVPTKVSELTNDSGFLTAHQSLANYSTLANTVKSLSISGKTITVTPGSGSAYTLTTQDTVDWSGVINKPTTFTPSSHTHGQITNDGMIGTAANKPLITTTGGVVTTGSFGTVANTFCQGNDSRLSDARTPKAHTHAKSDITDFPTLATVATSGSYADLSNKPTIPVIDSTLSAFQADHLHPRRRHPLLPHQGHGEVIRRRTHVVAATGVSSVPRPTPCGRAKSASA